MVRLPRALIIGLDVYIIIGIENHHELKVNRGEENQWTQNDMN